MSDNHQCARSFNHTSHDLLESFWVKSPEALVKNHQIGILQKRAADVYAAALTVRQSPACFSHHLEYAGRHSVEQISETEIPTDRPGLQKIFPPRRPASAHEQVEGKGARKDVIFVKLRGTRHQ